LILQLIFISVNQKYIIKINPQKGGFSSYMSKNEKLNDTKEIANFPTLTDKQMKDFSLSLQYMKTAKLILRDLENSNQQATFFKKYKKDDVIKWLESPEKYEKELRNASIYLYNASNHYKRLVQYFGKMALFAYIAIPYKLNIDEVDKEKFKQAYKKNLDYLDTLNIKHEFLKIMDVIFVEDVFYGYEYSSKDSYFIQKMPPDYCRISSIVDGVYCYQFDFAYFNTPSNTKKLESWDKEFKTKFDIYKLDPKQKWQELDSNKTICIKLNEGFNYSIPPFIGVFASLYDLEDYKALKKIREEIGNYKLLSLEIPLTDDGDYKFNYDEAVKFYNMMGAVLPENIGLALTPLKISEHSFDKAGQSLTNGVAEAEDAFWNSTGTSSLLFSSNKSGASVINNSIKSDEEIVFALFRQFERWLSARLKQQSGTYKFKVQILDVTIFNKQEFLDQLIKVGTYGIPVISKINAVLENSPNDTNALLFLENDILEYHNKLKPLVSSHTQSGSDESGNPQSDEDDLDEAGEKTREQDQKREKLVK